MKVIDSGMPAEDIWSDFFNIDLILDKLQINSINNLVEIGCGYGTFTIPTSKHVTNKLYAFDIEQEMINIVNQKLINDKITNIVTEQRDVLTQTTGLQNNSIDYVMLFNILHHDSPDEFLAEAYRILKPNGKIGIIHWRSDISTPRGPDYSIRPKPEQIIEWLDKRKFNVEKEPIVIEPYHFGMIISKI
ncbi:MAG: class I SAM-dependent methyltransferase [Bacteroidota bacterium]